MHVVLVGDDGWTQHAVGGESTVFGCDKSQADVAITGLGISPRHFEIVIGNDGQRIRDLASDSGTFLNGNRVRDAELAAEDILTVGQYRWIVRMFESSEKPRTAPLGSSTGRVKTAPARFRVPDRYQRSDNSQGHGHVKTSSSEETADCEVSLQEDVDSESEIVEFDEYDDFAELRSDSLKPLNTPETNSSVESTRVQNTPSTDSVVRLTSKREAGVSRISVGSRKTRAIVGLLALITLWLGWGLLTQHSLEWQALQELSEIHQKIIEFRESKPSDELWQPLIERTKPRAVAIRADLEEVASADNLAAQELLRAVRDCLQKHILKAPGKINHSVEGQFTKHIATAKSVLTGTFSGQTFDDRFPGPEDYAARR